jgi:hypothetical protein
MIQRFDVCNLKSIGLFSDNCRFTACMYTCMLINMLIINVMVNNKKVMLSICLIKLISMRAYEESEYNSTHS